MVKYAKENQSEYVGQPFVQFRDVTEDGLKVVLQVRCTRACSC
jgi:hypothetical protein